MSAIFVPNVLEYIKKILNIRTSMQLYYWPLDRPNITYTVVPITLKFKFRDLNFLVLEINGVSVIKKTIIFVDSITKGIEMANYLRSLLPTKLQDKIHQLIHSFPSIPEIIIKTGWLDNFLNGDTQILI